MVPLIRVRAYPQVVNLLRVNHRIFKEEIKGSNYSQQVIDSRGMWAS